MANEAVTKKQDPVIEKMTLAKNNLIARLPAGIDRDKFFLGILTAIQRSKAVAPAGKSLADCEPNSVLLAAFDAAEVGCSLSPALQLGWLIPYGKECNFQPSYRFFIQKAFETKEVKAFFAEVVYAGDRFDRQFAPKRNLFHAPGDDPDKRKKDTAIGAYALVQFTDDMIEFEYLTKEQIERHRNKSKQPNSMKWTDFWEEGWRITPIRVLAKRLPLKNRDFENLIEAINTDGDKDIVIAADEIMEPSIPREVPQEPKQPAEQPKQAATEQPKAEAPKEEPKSESAAPPANDMLTGDDPDPYLTPADMQVFWDKAFAANWKKSEVLQFIVKDYKVAAVKDLRRSQARSALEAITQGARK
jgi:recombination protein RecT